MKTTSSETRLGLVIGQLSPGGAERQITRLAIEMSQRSATIPIVFCLSAYIDPYGPQLTEAGIRWYAPPRYIKSSFTKLLWLIRQIKTARCDLLYGFLHVGNIYAGAAALILNCPLIASIRSANSAFSPAMQTLVRFFLNRADIVVSNSNSGLEILHQEFHVKHMRVTVVPNILIPMITSNEARSSLRQRWGVTDEPVIGTIAQIKPEKRAGLFLDIFTAMNARTPAHFIWVGDGPERENLEAQVALLDPQLRSRLHLEGYQTDIAAYLSAFDIFILTSAYEGSPNAVLEAMSAGKVCVATRSPGLIEALTGPSPDFPIGILCDRDDANKIVASIVEVWHDNDKMTFIGKNAKEWTLTQFSPEIVVKAYDQIFTQVLTSRAAGLSIT